MTSFPLGFLRACLFLTTTNFKLSKLFIMISDSIISSIGRWLTDWTLTSTGPMAGSLSRTARRSTPLPNYSGWLHRRWVMNKSELNTRKLRWWLGSCLTAILTQTGDTHMHINVEHQIFKVNRTQCRNFASLRANLKCWNIPNIP